MYPEDEKNNVSDLVRMWIAGRFRVQRKQHTHLMDMAIGHKYLKILVDLCLFQIVKEKKDLWPRYYLSVHFHPVICDMATYVGQKEDNCIFMACQNLRFFLEVHDKNCRRVSLANNYIENLSIKYMV